jgi:hypothetical protein
MIYRLDGNSRVYWLRGNNKGRKGFDSFLFLTLLNF